MSDDEADAGDEAATSQLVERGSDLAGALVGGAVGLIGGPLGALGGAALGVAVKHVAASLAGRLWARQTERAGAALLFIARDKQEREGRGEAPRDDGFFDARGALRSEAEEVLEAVLLQAANSYQEQKVPYLAHLYDGVAHDVSISSEDAHALIALAERLSFRQLIALAVLAEHDSYSRQLARAAGRRDEGRGSAPDTLAFEIDELGEIGVVGAQVEDKGPYRQGAVYGTQKQMSEQRYGALRLLPLGALLHRLMRLQEIPTEQKDRWVQQLGGVTAAPLHR